MDLPANGQMMEQGSDKALYVRFFNHPVKNASASMVEGRPIFAEKLYIEISAPADKTSQVMRAATDADKERFPRHWAHFERQGGVGVVGTMLKEWPLVSVSMIAEWNGLGIYTVEQLAGMSDSNIGKILQGTVYRAKAQAWLAAAKEGAPLMAMQDELKSRDDKIAQLEREVRELLVLANKRSNKPRTPEAEAA